MYDIEVVNRVKDILIRNREALSIAESVTSGHLQAAVSLATKATEFYQGGVTTYNLVQKTKILQIDPVHAVSCNCVSEKVASEMAVGVSALFKTEWSIAITGYAAPMPEMGINDLFAHWSIAHLGKIKKSEIVRAKKDDPLKVQVFYTNHLLNSLLQVLDSVNE